MDYSDWGRREPLCAFRQRQSVNDHGSVLPENKKSSGGISAADLRNILKSCRYTAGAINRGPDISGELLAILLNSRYHKIANFVEMSFVLLGVQYR